MIQTAPSQPIFTCGNFFAGKLKYRFVMLLVACCLACAISFPVHADLHIVAWNTFNNPDNEAEDTWFSTIFEAMGRIDILAVVETDTGSSVRLANVLSNIYENGSYDVITSSSFGGDRTGLVYDTSTVILLNSTDLTTIGSHPIVRGKFRPVGTGGEVDFYIYAVHLKSGSSTDDKNARATEALNLRANADALGEDVHVIYAGDFNLLGSSEVAWTNMLADGPGQAFDVAEVPGEWRDNADFLAVHTQDPRKNMDDRFDLQLVSGKLLDGAGLDYVPGSFHVFANNGTHALGSAIDTGTGADATVLAALMAASDHLPISATYQFEPTGMLSAYFDENGDRTDFLLWQAGYPRSTGATYLLNDADYDGDEIDFLLWQRNYPYPTVLSSVPEPNSLAMLAIGGLDDAETSHGMLITLTEFLPDSSPIRARSASLWRTAK